MYLDSNQEDTIAAIATPPGQGAIAIIRVSGKKAFFVVEKIFSGPVSSYASHTAHYGKILGEKKEVIDSVLLLVMKGPNSYTGEDSVEIHCHGGAIVTRKVLECVLEAGARAAAPGEFTFRAFSNQKMDLTQAEAVQELIAASNERALSAAEKQLDGALFLKISEFQEELTSLAAVLEAWVDFPEEDLEFLSQEEFSSRLQKVLEKMENLAKTFHEGKKLFEGVQLSIVGAPNVGKSSLMNALLGKEKAIVSPIPGTTRDLIEEEIEWNSLHFQLVDTAGIRPTKDVIEQEGIKRSKKAIKEADLILLVLDASRSLEKEDEELIEQCPEEKTLFVWNKSDLAKELKREGIFVSALKREGLNVLQDKILSKVWQGKNFSKDEILISKLRHREALLTAVSFCQKVLEGLKSKRSPEFVSFDLRMALQELGTVIGKNVTETILSEIFSKFCIGK